MSVVSPQEAQEWLNEGIASHLARLLANTVATEPDRIAEAERRGAVKALRAAARSAGEQHGRPYRWLNERADAILDGADL